MGIFFPVMGISNIVMFVIFVVFVIFLVIVIFVVLETKDWDLYSTLCIYIDEIISNHKDQCCRGNS